MIRTILINAICLLWVNHAFAQKTDVQQLNEAVRNVTNVIMHDVYSPPAASRIYAYSAVAAYEVMQQGSDQYPSYYGKINDMPLLQQSTGQNNLVLTGLLSFYYTAQSFLFSYKSLNPYIDSLINSYRPYLSEKEILNAQLWAGTMAMKMMGWAGEDNFREIHNRPRYELLNAPYAWQPTPPDYADPVEPYWGSLRPFVLDSGNQVIPSPCPVFSTEKNSEFYSLATFVYETGKNLTEEQILITQFWDDNPYTTNYAGHLQYGRKKISPAGHWLDITRIAIETSGCDVVKAAQAYACVSVAIADGFISCWKEKFTSNLIRPETYINKYIDELWKPYLQTPPFPEYTSGHSVISAASATVLTKLFGDNFVFTDVIETEFDLPTRQFSSFMAAAREASASRVYGGIHYVPAIANGILQGELIGEKVIEILLMN